MPEIIFDSAAVSYEGTPVLEPLSLTLREQRIGVIGANGGGKSTLIRMINGLGEPSSGRVLVDGLDVAANGRQVRKKVGFVFSDAENQIVMPTVREDIAFSLRRHKIPRAEKQRRVEEMMDRFHLTAHADQSPHTLSGGQKQLLALAAVLIIEPEVVIADEPTTLLDLRNRMLIREVFRTLPQQLIVVSHDLDFLSDFNRVICIDNHRIAADGDPSDVIPHYVNLMMESV
ncbi:energy-coupling factor ABC transporter ATP-binding protein [Corynebacterium gallinarum]|uniref:ABC transporter ATP-binding protein n=1 Tax=Corynebacterium gallinarum TaxID=2762214 RepID=A0A8I0HBX5_9CORY|nr:ABC transporter ATP-binding protein [Corynebacterium gallinarum]MBD8028751.1 ABC transporter ATP-binding protein [Corynebacterium gallinarum]NMB23736.1 ABC transporter ATP-binding protein [Corynebacterium sp.]